MHCFISLQSVTKRSSKRCSASRGRGRSISNIFLTRPGLLASTTTRSDRNAASAISWVMNSAVAAAHAPDTLQLHVHLLARDRIERAERLVHEQDGWRHDQRARDRDPLLHAARKLDRVIASA